MPHTSLRLVSSLRIGRGGSLRVTDLSNELFLNSWPQIPSRLLRGRARARPTMIAVAAPTVALPTDHLPSAECCMATGTTPTIRPTTRSEEHTSELQSRQYLVCR